MGQTALEGQPHSISGQFTAIYPSQTPVYVWVLYRGCFKINCYAVSSPSFPGLMCVQYSSWQIVATKSRWKVASASLQPLRSMLQLTHSPVVTKGSHRQYIHEGTWNTYFSKTSLRFQFHTVSHYEIYSLSFLKLFENIKVTQH